MTGRHHKQVKQLRRKTVIVPLKKVSRQQQQFQIHARVCACLPADKTRVGTVVEVYTLVGEWRYSVKFDDGTEGVFFDFELEPFAYS
jgi:hypothetical protein